MRNSDFLFPVTCGACGRTLAMAFRPQLPEQEIYCVFCGSIFIRNLCTLIDCAVNYNDWFESVRRTFNTIWNNAGSLRVETHYMESILVEEDDTFNVHDTEEFP